MGRKWFTSQDTGSRRQGACTGRLFSPLYFTWATSLWDGAICICDGYLLLSYISLESLLQSTQRCAFLITYKVLMELDHHKEQPSSLHEAIKTARLGENVCNTHVWWETRVHNTWSLTVNNKKAKGPILKQTSDLGKYFSKKNIWHPWNNVQHL